MEHGHWVLVGGHAHMEKVKNRPRNHRPPPPSAYPWLVYCHGKRLKSQTFYSISDPQNIQVRSIPELRNKKVWTSCHGWLVMSHEADTDFHLWNPLTLESVQLPPLELKPKQYVTDCLLTSPPDDLSSTFLLFVCDPRSIIFCCIQDKKWITRGYDEEIKVIREYLCRPVICNNQIYATVSSGRTMVLIEIIKPSRLVIRLQNCHLPFVPSLGSFGNTFLVESCGDIFAIEIHLGGVNYDDIIGIAVFKLDFSTMTWDQVNSCPGRAFFLSNHSVISCTTIDFDKKENQIYFTRDEDNRLYSYSIEDKSISVSLPCAQIPTPWKTPIWIKPDIRFLESFAETRNSFNEKEQGMKEDSKRRLDQCTKVDMRGEENLHFLDLPKHIVERIATNLSLFDYMNFRAVSREFRSAAPPKKWLTNSVELESNVLNPWLMFPGKVKHIRSLVDPRLGGKYYITIPPILEGAAVAYSKYGWFLMWKKESFMFFNPLTKYIISLPDMVPFCQRYCFSSVPDSSDCLVVGIAFDIQEMFITRPGWTEWKDFEFYDQISFKLSHLTNPVLLKGAFYFLGENGDLATLTFDQEENPSIEVLNVKVPCSSFQENFLVECGGEELLSVFVGKGERWVQVFKFNESALAWEQVESLGNKSLYLCGLSSFATEAKTPGMENKIHFPRFCGESIIFYSLATGKFHTSESGDSLTNYHGTRKQLNCSWIEPRWSQSDA